MSTTETPVYVEISFEQPGGTSAVWGSITGTLSNQTDLQTALNAKFDDPTGTTAQYLRGDGSLATFPSLTGYVPYTGATQDVSLGEYGINVGNLIYDTTPTGIPTDQGATYWDDQAETVALVMNGTIQKIGEDTFYHVKNSTGSTIAKGVAVRFAGTDGGSGKILIAPFLANGTYPSQYYMGITAEAITNGSNGKVYHFGKIRGVNTSAFADGDILYCSTTVAGGFQTTAPSAPNNIVVAAAVINAGNNGTLMVRTTTGSNINTDEGVLLTTPTSGQVLKYNGSLWVNDSVSGALGYTPSNAATTLTINGVTFDLSTSRTFTVGSVTGSGASGQVAYWTGASAQSGSNNLFWDATNSRLGIGTNTPTDLLSLKGSSTFASISLETTGYATKSYIGNYQGRFYQFGSNRRIDGFISNASAAVAYVNVFADNGIAHVTLSANNTNNADARDILRVWGSGNVTIQNGGTFTDSGQRLQVQGTTLLNGNVTFSSATGMTWDATNSRLGIGTNAPTNDLSIVKTSAAAGEVGIYLRNLTASGSAFNAIYNDVNESGAFQIFGSTFAATSFRNTLSVVSTTANGIAFLANSNNANAHIKFVTTTSLTERMRIVNSTGNVLIQNGGTFTDSGERLQVTGTMKVTASGTTNTTFATSATAVYNSYNPTGYNSWLIGVENDYFAVFSGRNIFYLNRSRSSGFSYLNSDYFRFGTADAATAQVDIAGSSTARASLRIRSGTAPTTPNDGDIWFDGTDIKMRIGGVTKTFTLT
jgi:hypothetical protein